MRLIDDSNAPIAPRRWVLPLVAAACLTLAACESGFTDDGPELEIPSGCVSGRLGCATDHNIALAVAKPSDLVRPRRQQPRDSQRRDAAISAYRQGIETGRASTSSAGTTLQGGNR